jgi:hypothetical protein
LLGLSAHILSVLLIYWVNRKLWKAGLALSLVAALYLALGTGAWYVAAYFGTPFFALAAAVTWWLGVLLMRTDAPAWWNTWGFAGAALITGLVRPEGVLLSGLILLSVVLSRGWSRSRGIVFSFTAVMLVLGGAYFAWHWQYFGYPLPNPYYRKGSGLLHWDSFWESLGYLLSFAGPFLLAFILGFRSRGTRSQAIAFGLPLVGFAATFILVSNETNFGGRFQYALWPMILMCFYPLVSGLPAEMGITRRSTKIDAAGGVWIVAAIFVGAAAIFYAAQQACRLTAQQQSCGIAYEADGRYDVAKLLAEYRGKDYIMATTEAGLLPLYSGWNAIDTWGLNDAWIAHHGDVTADYLDRYAPHLIVFHAYFSPLVPASRAEKDLAHDWHRMTLTLLDYAETHGYVLAAVFGDSPYESHYYYVRSDFEDSGRIVREIARLRDYRWFATGKKAINYADVLP